MRRGILATAALVAACVQQQYVVQESVTSRGVLKVTVTGIDEYKHKFAAAVDLKSLYKDDMLIFFSDLHCFRKNKQGTLVATPASDYLIHPGQLVHAHLVCQFDESAAGGPFALTIARVLALPNGDTHSPGKPLATNLTVKVKPKRS